jgi:hypothetical protein
MILGTMLCLLCGCAPGPSKSYSHDAYLLTVGFDDSLIPMHEMEIDVRPGVLFDVHTQDKAGFSYRVEGAMRRKSPEGFGFDYGKIVLSGHGQGMEIGLPADIALGEGTEITGIGGMFLYGVSYRLTKK